MKKKTVVFDLDDTLVKEIDYLKSAFKSIAIHLDAADGKLFNAMFEWYKDKQDVFGILESRYEQATKAQLKTIYRNHVPNFNPDSESKKVLIELKNQGHNLGLVTDGFSVTQRNKLKALAIEDLFDLIIISEEFGSEKPNENNFSIFSKFATDDYFYVSDNVNKDFLAPNKLGWTTVCLLDNGKNVHKQDFKKELIYLPSEKIYNLTELKSIINNR